MRRENRFHARTPCEIQTLFGFPDQSTDVPSTQSKRQALLLSLKNFLTANPSMEVSTPKITVTAAEADTTLIGQARALDRVSDAGRALILPAVVLKMF
ncbi:MAG TPA: hypothetical protein VMV89_04185 [Candidatus Paceibacterota bacterium]|nr:hypothetical protein [Candidatus Paceibacterota bacterium]